MAEPDPVVKHFLVCRRVVTDRPRLEGRYTLLDVSYAYDVPAAHEWPVRPRNLWVFVRFYDGHGSRRFTLSVAWLDGPGGEAELAYFDLAVQFRAGLPVFDRAWNVSAVRFPGPGRYAFRLSDDRSGRPMADDFILLRRPQ